MSELSPLPSEVLPAGIRARFVSGINGLCMHILVSGKSDWGVYQRPGAVERMQDAACIRFAGSHLLDGAGHWVQQEQAARGSELLLDFLKGHAA